MHTPSPIEEIRKKLQTYPQIKYEEGKDYIGVQPADTNGFHVLLTTELRDITVCALGWHETFKKPEEALNRFVFLLSESARLKVHYCGNFAFKYVLQYKDNDTWSDESEVGTFFYPFWEKKRIVYLQNHFLK